MLILTATVGCRYVPVGQSVTIEAITNDDVTGTGFVIQITSLATGKAFNSCGNGTTCTTQAKPPSPRLTTYLATVGPPAGPHLAQDSVTVGWFLPGTTPTPSPLVPSPSPPPATPVPVLGPTLASGAWIVSHTPDLTAEVDRGQDIRTVSIDRWNGTSFVFGPNAYHEDLRCAGVPGWFDVLQYVQISPVDWDGFSPITHLQGFMTLTGTVNSTGTAHGCSDYFLRYTTDVTHI